MEDGSASGAKVTMVVGSAVAEALDVALADRVVADPVTLSVEVALDDVELEESNGGLKGVAAGVGVAVEDSTACCPTRPFTGSATRLGLNTIVTFCVFGDSLNSDEGASAAKLCTVSALLTSSLFRLAILATEAPTSASTSTSETVELPPAEA